MENIKIKDKEQLKDWLFHQIQSTDECLQIVDRLQAKDSFADPTEPYKLISRLNHRQTQLYAKLERLVRKDTPVQFRISQIINGLEANYGRAATNV